MVIAMIRNIPGKSLHIADDAYIAENATLVGEIDIAPEASIWYGAVLRGDAGAIRIGRRCAIEDNVTIHASTVLGDGTIVGHNAVVHGCTVGKGCLIGMSATVMTGAVIGDGSLIAAGCLVSEGKIIPPGSLVMGVPGRVVGPLTPEQEQYIAATSKEYREMARIQLPHPIKDGI